MSKRRILFELVATAWDTLLHGDVRGHVQALAWVLAGFVQDSDTVSVSSQGGER